ncbi:MAG: quinone-dependent dihydroorotate dehydrogenase [Pseudomonadota bacterium]
MKLIEKLGLTALYRFDPERAHGLAVRALKAGLVPAPGPFTSSRLKTEIAGLTLPNPVGLAAGFDKNGEVIVPLSRAGFGFIEVGAATPRPQPGNPKPRLFRLTEDQGAINRFGFNNEGMDVIAERLAKRPRDAIVGLNLGANKDSENKAEDFTRVLERTRDHLDFATVNVSSPNTEKLRDLQGADALNALLQGVMAVRGDCPVFLKIAPDLTKTEITEIADIAKQNGIDAIIATNTTLDRTGLNSRHANEVGGLSGAPLFERSTRVLAMLAQHTDIPLIGVGGISTAEQAYAKIKAGAVAVQLYTALVFQGFSVVDDIAHGLDALVEKDGFTHISEAVGIGKEDWL